MVIRKQPIISWILGNEPKIKIFDKVRCVGSKNPIHLAYLSNSLDDLFNTCKLNLSWGLPEYLTSPFEKMMEKLASSYFSSDHELFQTFCENKECGILITKSWGTIVYEFSNDMLHIWTFSMYENISTLYLYFFVKSTDKNIRLIHTNPTLLNDEVYSFIEEDKRNQIYECLANFIMSYLAVKKYGPVEKIEKVIAPPAVMTELSVPSSTDKENRIVKNESGQEVIIMDSRWFREIINNNEIAVKGFLRHQRKKNADGEWYYDLIEIAPYKRHGYHRKDNRSKFES